MDSLDISLFQAVTRRRLTWFGGSDPRVTGRALAEELGVDRSTVTARLRQWEEAGFVLRRKFLPNPRLFGVGKVACRLRVDRASSKPEVLEALMLADGVNSALDSVGTQFIPGVVNDGEEPVRRRLRLLERLPHVVEVGPPRAFPTPPPSAAPTPLGWRVMSALFRHPEASPGEVAEVVGVSTRTLRRHYRALLESGALWYFHIFDFTQYTGAVAAFIVVGVDPGAPEGRVVGELREALPPFAVYPGMDSLVWDQPGAPRQLFVHLESVGAVEEALAAALKVEGVLAAEASYPRMLHIFDHWWAERLEAAVRRANG